MKLGYVVRNWWYKRFHRTVRIGWVTVSSAMKTNDMPRFGIGIALLGYGLMKGRGERRRIYKTSIDVDQGTTIRVMRGRHPIAETSPLP
ncbi:MAG: hypothetical protein U9N79_10035 [Actinomycetota bacterium]|nr:hypothetical protein [Actinomycetota bacterium]